MGTAWTNLIQTFLVIPTGATTGARIAINVDNSGAILVYNASNQLFESIAAMGGTDPFGNSYGVGITVGVPDHPQIELTVASDGESALVVFPTGSTHIHNSAALQAFEQNGTGAGAWDQLQVLGPQDNVQLDEVITTWLSSSNDGTSQTAQLQQYYSDPTGSLHLYQVMDFAGFVINAGQITAVQPGTGGSRAVPAVPESWHNAVLGAGFTTGVGDQVPRYRFEPIAGGQVRLDGVVYTSAATAANAAMFTLPAGYRPTQRKRYTGVTSVSGNTLGGTLIDVLATGVVQLGPAASAANQQIVLDGITFPVD